MKIPLIMFFAVFAIAGTAYADKHIMDKNVSKTAVPVSGWGTGKGDAGTKKHIGETEKNLQTRDN